MNSPKVIAIGEALIDRLGPIGGDPSFDTPRIDCFGGAPANVACGLSRLGVNVAFIGSLGADSFGQSFKNLMINRGINTAGLQQDNERPTRIVLVRRDAHGERFFGGFEGDTGLGFADQAISLEKITQAWPSVSDKAKWLILGTIPLASQISSETFYWCVEHALKVGIKIALDLNWRPTFWRQKAFQSLAPTLQEKKEIHFILKNVSLIKLAKEEAKWFFDNFDPIEISSSLPNRPSVIITDGSNPISWFINNHFGKSMAISVPSVVDTTGAGDAFTAGLIYKLLPMDMERISKEMAEEIIQFAIACGAFVCQGEGAINSQPYLKDLEKLLFSTNGGMS